MKILLVGINAKYVHSNLAIRYIQKYAEGQGIQSATVEYSINQSPDLVLEGILGQSPDVVAFSAYLWNIEMVRKLAKMIKQVRPEITVILGGPEVSYDSIELMESSDAVDFIINGEGERTSAELFRTLAEGTSVETIKGITYRKDTQPVMNPPSIPLPMSEVPFPYDEGLEGLEHHMLYYETSRGCPYKCQYCLSSIETGVRFRPMEMVEKELDFFLRHKVRQVKFVDRTFNAKKSHTLAIWKYLHEHDNDITNFHFEITADLLTEDTLDFLAGVRPGLFQFEVGVQSTHMPTIQAVERTMDFEVLKARVIKAMEAGNIHMHLDLIAGLPLEDYKTFGKSFNDVMAIRPEQLQLGFLKALKGSKIHQLQKDYGLIYREFAPYEVLATKELSYEELRRLKSIEELLESYYNSQRYSTSIEYLIQCHSSSFDCFEQMTDHWLAKGYFQQPHNKIHMYELLYEYGASCDSVDTNRLADLLKHDLCLQEKPKKWPGFIQQNDDYKQDIRNFYQDERHQETYFANYKGYTAKQISRMTHLERFDYNVASDGDINVTWMFYDYKDRNPMTGRARSLMIPKIFGTEAARP